MDNLNSYLAMPCVWFSLSAGGVGVMPSCCPAGQGMGTILKPGVQEGLKDTLSEFQTLTS